MYLKLTVGWVLGHVSDILFFFFLPRYPPLILPMLGLCSIYDLIIEEKKNSKKILLEDNHYSRNTAKSTKIVRITEYPSTIGY